MFFFFQKLFIFFFKVCVCNLNLHLSVVFARWYFIQPLGWLVDVQVSRCCNLVLCDLLSPLQILTVESIVFLLDIPSEGLHPDVEWYWQSNARCKWSGGERRLYQPWRITYFTLMTAPSLLHTFNTLLKYRWRHWLSHAWREIVLGWHWYPAMLWLRVLFPPGTCEFHN